MADRRPGIYHKALAHRDFRWLLTGFAVSSTGDYLYVVALAATVWDRTGSAGWVTAAVVLRQVPLVVLPPLAGALADRLDRRRLLVAVNAAMAVTMTGMATAAALDGPVWVLVVLAVLLNCLATPINPASTGLLPEVVPEGDLAAANAVQASVDSVALLAGPALGAAALLLGSPAAAFGVNALTFVVAAACLIPVGAHRSPRASGRGAVVGDPVAASEPEAAASSAGLSALRALAGDRPLVVITAAVVAACFALGATGVLFVVVSDVQLATGSAGLGWLLAGVGLGGLLGVQVADRLAAGTAVGRAVLGCLAVAGLSLLALPVAPGLVAAVALTVVFGAGYLVTEVLLTTFLQRALDPSLLGRATGLVDSAAYAALLLGALVAGLAVEAAGLVVALLVAGLVPVVVAAAGWRTAAAADTRVHRDVERLRPLVDLLAAAPALAGAGRPALEKLTGVSIIETLADGAAVVREGEPATDFFVVARGVLGVHVSGWRAALPDLVRGDSFGEIGLLRSSPRTATVTATGAAEVVRVPGAAFLEVVRGEAEVLTALTTLAAARLARSRTEPGASG